MRAIALEIRDRATFIPILAVDMNPGVIPFRAPMEEIRQLTTDHSRRAYLLRRVGYPCDGRPNVLITRLSGDGTPGWNDPHGWRGRTFPTAHAWIIENWEKLRDGDVVDVEYILGEKPEPKKSEREEVPGA